MTPFLGGSTNTPEIIRTISQALRGVTPRPLPKEIRGGGRSFSTTPDSEAPFKWDSLSTYFPQAAKDLLL